MGETETRRARTGIRLFVLGVGFSFLELDR